MKKHFFNGAFPGLVIAVIIAAGFFFINPNSSQAIVERAVPQTSIVIVDTPATIKETKTTIWDAVVKAGRVSFTNALRSLVNQVAYETATYIGSGDKGQVPVFYTKKFGEWIREQGANAGGQFIEELAKSSADINSGMDASFIDKYNICSPDFSVTMKISLGLTDYSSKGGGLAESRCNLNKIWQAGVNEIEASREDPYYLHKLADLSFDPATTDVGAALTLFGAIDAEKSAQIESNKLNREETGGWLDITGFVSGWRTAPPGENSAKLAQSRDMQTQSFFSQTGDIFVDATNIFLNQLALTAFNKLISKVAETSGDPTGYYAQNARGGINRIAKQNSGILQARFNERTDYDILSQLSSCTDESRPGPTNCVITQQFAQAVTERLTVADAINKGIIDPSKRVGFNQQGSDLSYKDGYPYRSLIILRKYRILPVGWEVAAQYIKDNPRETSTITLSDLITCFSDKDSYTGDFDAYEWCKGLIDPNWVLKVPKQYCGMEGYGPEIFAQMSTPDQKGLCMEDLTDCLTYPTKDGCQRGSDGKTCSVNEDCTNPLYTKCNFSYSRNLQVTRNAAYCADEQSCIKENANGSCAFYGYCTEEKRLWRFGENEDTACEARENTCRNFKNSAGDQVSFLENTLDYANCGLSQVGCQRYATVATSYANNDVTWNSTVKQAYFNKNITACNEAGEGCHQFVRTNEGLGTNLIADGSFELSSCISGEIEEEGVDARNTLIPRAHAQAVGGCQTETLSASAYLKKPNNRWYIAVDNGPVRAGIVNAQPGQGAKSLYIEGNGGLYSKDSGTPSLLPSGFVMEADTYYTLSANVYVEGGTARIGFGNQPGQYTDWSSTGSWKVIAVVFYNPASAPVHEFFLKGTTSAARFYADQIQLTKGRLANSYSEYMSTGVVYEKLLPAYLEATCYMGTRGDGGSEFDYKTGAPAICYQFARKCAASEVGCLSYKAQDSGIRITGKVKTPDYCPGSCIGYNTYVQQANAFYPQQASYLIPNTGRSCSAESVGCTAFTNLDKLSQGGESVEYYTSLRSCLKPDASKCGQFYTWEGSEEAGYQVRVYSLQRNQASAQAEPLSTMSPTDEARLCNATVFQKTPSEPGYNYDCRQFYASDGSVSYHLYSKTITCSEDCHPYRREVATATDCTNGTIDGEGRCIYNAIPGEGSTCSAAEVGCQEYTGNIASNTRSVLSPSPSTFDNVNNLLENWRGGENRTVALNAGGRSLLGSRLERTVGEDVKRNNSYVVSFLARPATANTSIRSINLTNQAGQQSIFSTTGTNMGTDWRLYTFNLSNLDHEVTVRGAGTSGEKFVMEFSGPVYVDNIRLTEIPDRYFLIKDSWTTPEECDKDYNGTAAPRYMLGCSAYTTADNSTLALRSFSALCQDSAAGCEAMIDTQNSLNSKKVAVNDTNGNGSCDPTEADCMETPADTMINAVYDRTKLCTDSAKGCQRMGAAVTYDGQTTFDGIDPYLKNDPDLYTSTVCTAAGLSCGQFMSADGGTIYFKDPGKEVCEWKLKAGTSGQYGWFKKDLKRCGGQANGLICSSDAQCSGNPAAATCQEVACEVSTDKTLGVGGGTRVEQPSKWVGLCTADQSSCTEYVDPISQFNSNIVRNPSYSKTSTTPPEQHLPWREEGASAAVQTVSLNLNTVYIIKGGANVANTAFLQKCIVDKGLQSAFSLRQLSSATNQFVATNGSTTAVGGEASVEIYMTSTDKQARSATCEIVRSNRSTNWTVDLRQAVVDYRLSDKLDKSTPNNLVSFNKGFILFNERAQSGKDKVGLRYNADKTSVSDNSGDGVTPKIDGPLNANVIIKTQPDRVCSKWLACNGSIPDPQDPSKQTCLGVGTCDSLDAEGRCNHFVAPAVRSNQSVKTVNNAGLSIDNLTGYSKVGYVQDLTNKITDSGPEYSTSLTMDYYDIANMKQLGEQISTNDNSVPNGGFENEATQGWTASAGDALLSLTQPQELQAIGINSIHAVKNTGQGTSYLPPVGRGMGRLKQETTADSKLIHMIPGRTYVLSAYVYTRSGDGGGAGIEIPNVNSGSPVIGTGTTSGVWRRYTVGFTVPTERDYNLRLFNRTSTVAYFDDIKIETSLNFRCSETKIESDSCTNLVGSTNQNPAKAQFIAPSCRLYPTASALDCTELDNNGVKNIGRKGYCLETDPKNPGSCLLWNPIDRIASEKTEPSISIEFDSQEIFYCITGEDVVCQGEVPLLTCKEFIKVKKDKYWYDRLRSGSTFKLSAEDYFNANVFYPTTERIVNIGNKYNKNNKHGIFTPLLAAGGTFGAYKATDLGISRPSVSVDESGDPNSYIPYFLEDYVFKTYGNVPTAHRSETNRNVCRVVNGATVPAERTEGNQFHRRDYIDSASIVELEAVDGGSRRDCYMDGHCEGNGYYASFTPPFDWTNARAGFPGGRWSNAWILRDNLFTIRMEGQASDDLSDRGSASFIYGWNIKDFRVAKSREEAIRAIKRVFVAHSPAGTSTPPQKLWELYVWDGSVYKDKTNDPDIGLQTISLLNTGVLTKCENNVRPTAYTASIADGTPGSDYCYIWPKLSNFKIDTLSQGNIMFDGEKELNVTFGAIADANQLPIKNIEFFYGYNSGPDVEASTSIFNNVNNNDSRSYKATFSYSLIKRSYNRDVCAEAGQFVGNTGVKCGLSKACCVLKPSIKVYDNWGYYDTLPYAGYVIVNETIN